MGLQPAACCLLRPAYLPPVQLPSRPWCRIMTETSSSDRLQPMLVKVQGWPAGSGLKDCSLKCLLCCQAIWWPQQAPRHGGFTQVLGQVPHLPVQRPHTRDARLMPGGACRRAAHAAPPPPVVGLCPSSCCPPVLLKVRHADSVKGMISCTLVPTESTQAAAPAHRNSSEQPLADRASDTPGVAGRRRAQPWQALSGLQALAPQSRGGGVVRGPAALAGTLPLLAAAAARPVHVHHAPCTVTSQFSRHSCEHVCMSSRPRRRYPMTSLLLRIAHRSSIQSSSDANRHS